VLLPLAALLLQGNRSSDAAARVVLVDDESITLWVRSWAAARWVAWLRGGGRSGRPVEVLA